MKKQFSLEERLELFKKDIQRLEKKHGLQLQAVIQPLMNRDGTMNGIVPQMLVVDLKK